MYKLGWYNMSDYWEKRNEFGNQKAIAANLEFVF